MATFSGIHIIYLQFRNPFEYHKQYSAEEMITELIRKVIIYLSVFLVTLYYSSFTDIPIWMQRFRKFIIIPPPSIRRKSTTKSENTIIVIMLPTLVCRRQSRADRRGKRGVRYKWIVEISERSSGRTHSGSYNYFNTRIVQPRPFCQLLDK